MSSSHPTKPAAGPAPPAPGWQLWWQASRPRTLVAGAVPVLTGTWLAWRLDHVFSPLLLALTLGSCLAIQMATNFFNDAIDAGKGADTERRLGPARLTAGGLVSSRAMLTAGVLMLAVATLLALPLLWWRGWPIVAIGLPSLWFSYGYTGGPWPLAYRGLGELFVILFFGLVAVAGSQFVMSGHWSVEGPVAGLQLGFLSAVLIAINNLRDIDEDRASGKRTLAARHGPAFGRALIGALLLAPALTGLWWITAGHPAAALLPLLILPLSLGLWRGVLRHPPGTIYNRFLGLSALHLLGFALLWGIGLTWTT